MEIHDDPSVQDLDGEDWGDPDDPFDWGDPENPDTSPSGLIRQVRHARRIPLSRLTPADLRLLIAQEVGVEYLVPLALPLLEEDPELEAYYFPTDLLLAVWSVPDTYWASHPAEFARLEPMLELVRPTKPDAGEGVPRPWGEPSS